jgi:hypothetical protein
MTKSQGQREMIVTSTVTAPQRSGSREQAQRLAAELGRELAGLDVELVFDHNEVATPSFLDELVRQVLVDRQAESLRVVNASVRARKYLERAAMARDVSRRLSFDSHSDRR